MFEYVDPFIGTGATELPPPQGLAASWWWPKPQVGNTHPGATYPFGMVSACSYSGAYPTGYGLYELNTEGVPPRMHEDQIASGFSHFHQSGTGAIRKYYNYFRVTPMLEPLDALGTSWELTDEVAEPGLLRGHPVVGHPLRGHRRPAQRGPPLHVPRAPRCPDRHRPVAGRPAHPVRRHGPAAGPPGDPGARRRPGRGGRRGGAAGRAPGVRQPATSASCSGTTGASSPAAPGSTSTGSGRPRCARSA